MTSHALLFILAAIGISETVYLIRKRIAHEQPVCILGEECTKVLESKYNSIFGIPNYYLGLLFYIILSFITAFLVIGVGPLFLWEKVVKISVAGAGVMSLYLIYLQWRIIRAWCFWCLMSALTVFVMAGIILVSDLIII